jgi:hypothetical protein
MIWSPNFTGMKLDCVQDSMVITTTRFKGVDTLNLHQETAGLVSHAAHIGLSA